MRSLFARLNDRFGKKDDGMTRREMMRRSLAAAAGLLLSDRLAFAGRRPSGPRVIVVGGGFAGLAAAYELSHAGADVTVLEARNRIGGRVLSFRDLVPGGTVEGGAELIGSNHPVWVRYRERFGLTFLDVTEEEDVEFPIMLNDRRLTASEAEQLWKDMDTGLNRMNEDAARIDDPFEPWRSADAAALDRRSLRSWIATLDTSPLGRAAIDAQLTADNGVHTAWQSYLGNLAMVKGGGGERFWTESEVYRCRGGNQQLATALVKGIGDDRVKLRAIVTGIEAASAPARVTLADGTRLETDHVILAVPPPVWNRIAIEPMLPAGLTPQMGSNVKFLMVLGGRFWRRSRLGPAALSEGPVQLTWEATDNQRTHNAAMVAFSGGPAADACRSWASAQRNENYLAALQPIYRGLRASFQSARFMDWPSDPWVKASYSFPAPGQVTSLGPLMATPIAGRLHFAGEHTCPAFVGYMEGALQSGVRVAERIIAPAPSL